MRAPARLLLTLAVATTLVFPTGAGAATATPAASALRQSVQAELTPTGEVVRSRVFTQVSVLGEGPARVVLPAQATDGLRNLDSFDRPRVDGGTVTWSLQGPTAVRTVADHDRALPVRFAISYTLDGEAVTPEQLTGRDGELTVTYRVTNVSGEPRTLRFVDGKGRAHTTIRDVPLPLVASLATTLDGRFAEVEAPGASVVGDGRGNTVVNWSLLLFPPLGEETAEVSYTTQVRDAVVPEAVSQVVPVSSTSFGSLARTEKAYREAAASTTALTEGADEIDRNLLRLAAGTTELLSGIGKLADGAGQLETGLGAAKTGAGQLAAGLGSARGGGEALAKGLGDLAGGAMQLSQGLGAARGGGEQLRDGLGKLRDGSGRLALGASELASGAGTLDAKAFELATGAGTLRRGAKDLLTGLTQFRDTVVGSDGLPAAQSGLGKIIKGVTKIRRGVGAPTTPSTLINGVALLALGVTNPAALDTTNAGYNPACLDTGDGDPGEGLEPCGVKEGLTLVGAGVDAVRAGLDALDEGVTNPAAFSGPDANPSCLDTGDGDPGEGLEPCGVVQGVQLLGGGADQLNDGITDQVVPGLSAIEDGADEMIDGTDNVAGCDVLSLLTPADDTPCGALDILEFVAGDGLGTLTLSPAYAGLLASVIDGIGTTGDADTLLGGLAAIRAGAGQLVAGMGSDLSGASCAVAEATAAAELTAVGSNTVRTALRLMSCGAEELEDSIGAPGESGTLRDGIAQLAAGAEQIDDGLTAISASVSDPSGTVTETLANGLGLLMRGMDNPAAFADGSSSNKTCIDAEDAIARGKEVCGLKQALSRLDDGLDELDDGLDDAVEKISAALGDTGTEGATLLYGMGQLEGGSRQLADGAGRLQSEGTAALAAGAAELAGGATQVADGTAAAASGSDELAGGLAALDVGGIGLVDGSRKAQSGAGELAGGLGQLDAGGKRLSDGLSDAAGGSTQLADGLSRAADGGSELSGGATRLREDGTRVMVDGVDDAAASASLLVARVQAVDERGRTEGLPYGSPTGTVASAVYKFEIAGAVAQGALAGAGRTVATAAALSGVMLLSLFRRRRTAGA